MGIYVLLESGVIGIVSRHVMEGELVTALYKDSMGQVRSETGRVIEILTD